MRLAVLVFLLSLPAFAQDTSGSVRRMAPETQASVQPPPARSCLDPDSPQGMDLRSVRGYRVGIEPVPGGTVISGAILRAYYWDFSAGKWGRGPMSDIKVLETSSLIQWSPDLPVLVRSGCVYYATENAGTSVIVRITAWTGAS